MGDKRWNSCLFDRAAVRMARTGVPDRHKDIVIVDIQSA